MNEGARGAADDGAVGVRAARRVYAVRVLTFAMKVGGEDGGLERIVRFFVVDVDEGREVFEWCGSTRSRRDEFVGDLVSL